MLLDWSWSDIVPGLGGGLGQKYHSFFFQLIEYPGTGVAVSRKNNIFLNIRGFTSF